MGFEPPEVGAQAAEAHFEGLARYTESYARRQDLLGALQAGEDDALRAQLRDLVESNPRIDRAFITTPDGVERVDWPQDATVIGQSFAFRDWYQGVSRLQRTYVSEVYRRAAIPRYDLVSIATPIPGAADETVGYLVAQHTMAALTHRLASIRPGASGRVLLFDRRGHLAVEREHEAAAPDEAPPEEAPTDPVVQRMLAGPETSFVERDPQTGESSLLSFSPVASIGWGVAASQPEVAVFAPAAALQRAVLALSIA